MSRKGSFDKLSIRVGDALVDVAELHRKQASILVPLIGQSRRHCNEMENIFAQFGLLSNSQKRVADAVRALAKWLDDNEIGDGTCGAQIDEILE